MRQYYLSLAFLLVCFLDASAQVGSAMSKSYWVYLVINDGKIWGESFKNEKVRESVTMGSKRTIIRRFDQEGRVIFHQGGRTPELHISYTDDSQFRELSMYKNGKLIERDSFVYDKGRPVACYYIDGKDRIFKQESTNYKDSLITDYSYKVKKGNKLKERKRTEYEYYEDGSQKKITFYKKGKPDYYTVFDCDPLGKSHKVKKDSSYNCIKTEVDSLGNKTEVAIINRNFYSTKVMTTWNKKGDKLSVKTYDPKTEEPMYYYFYLPGAKMYREFISFKKNKEYYRQVRTFDENEKMTSQTLYMHSKLKSRSVVNYNERGIPSGNTEYDRHNKVQNKSAISYQYY
jgi:hypothetical protein